MLKHDKFLIVFQPQLMWLVSCLFQTFCLIMFLAYAAFAEPPQINIVDGDGHLSQSQDPAKFSTDFNISGHIVGETTSADILPGETWNMRFANPNDSFLLRVLDPSGTRILGNLNIFNGCFALLNTHGIDVGASGRVNVNNGSFIASTLDIQNRNFIAGKYEFGGAAGAGNRSLSNHGLIRTTGASSVVLLGSAVSNAGAIEAPLGKVALASGNAVTLGLDVAGLIMVDVSEPVKEKVFDMDGQEVTTQVSNTGTIDAYGGRVTIDAKALAAVFDRSVNLEGRIRADKAVQGVDGVIRIVASDEVLNAGELTARNGEVSLLSGGLIKTTGLLIAERLFEQGFAFQMGGVVQVGLASLANADGAVVLTTGSYSGTFEDSGDIIVNNNAQITLSGPVVFQADSDPVTHAHDGRGVFTMNSGSSIVGGNNDLTVYSSAMNASGDASSSILRGIYGVNTLRLFSHSLGSNPTYLLADNIAILGDFGLMGGFFDANGQDVTVDGLITVDGGDYLSGAGVQVFNGGLTVSNGTFTGSTGTGRVDINGDLLLASGGTLEGGTDIYISGDWTNNGGTFVPGTGTVTFFSTIADQLINGTAVNQTFNDITVAKGSTTLTVGGATTALSMRNLTLESGIFSLGTATTVNISGDVVFSPLALANANGLTIDADTFTVDDMARFLGDTARTYYPVTDAVLDAMIAGGQIKTLIIGIPYDQEGYSWLGQFWGGSVPAGANRVNMVDNNYISYIAHVKDRLRAAGSQVKLVVEFGNEYNLHPEWFGGNVNNWFAALTTATAAVHSVFGSDILVSTASGDIPSHFLAMIQTGVDMVGMNTYRGLGGIRSLVTDWNAACIAAGITTPLYLSETGFASWAADGGEFQQNVNVRLLWDEIFKSGLGVTFMSFEDNQRKGGSLFAQDVREDYWGWLRQDKIQKPVYDTMAQVWALPELQAGNSHINVSGDWINNGGIFSPGTGTVIFNADNAGHQIKTGSSAFTNVVFNALAAGGAWTVVDDNLIVNGNLILSEGRVTLDKNLTVQGNLDIQAGTLDAAGQTVNLAGDWDNAGTFIHGHNTLTLTGNDQSVSGNNIFYNLTKIDSNGSALTFQSGATQTIDGLLTLRSESGQLLRLRADVPGDQWRINARAVDMNQLDLRDAFNTGSSITLLSALDSGNNTGFIFGNKAVLSFDVPWWNILDIPRLTADSSFSFEAGLFSRLLTPDLISDEIIPSVASDNNLRFVPSVSRVPVLWPGIGAYPFRGVPAQDIY